jgi:hypothetical protein
MSRSFGQKVQVTAFNEMIAESNVSYIEGSATYGFLPSNFRAFTATGGSTDVANRLFSVSTGTSVGGYGAIQSFRSIPDRVGKSVVCRLSGYFSSNVANSWQGMGLISIGEELSFGYNGVDFGVWHRYGGLSEVRTITVTTGAGGSETLTLTLNSVAYSIPITSGTANYNAYEIAAWLNNSSNQTIWAADQIDDTVIINAVSDGSKSGTYTYSSSGAGAGSIVQDTAGVTKTSSHIPTGDWNGVTLFDGFEPSNGNLYMIQYQNMGYGNVIFSIMNPNTSKYDIVHTIRWANSSASLGLPNPSLRAGFYAASTGATTNLSVYINSIEVSIGGLTTKTRNPRSYSATQAITATDETAILTLRNRRTYNGYNNQVDIEPILVDVSNETARNATLRIRASTNVGIEQDFTNAGENLVSDVDTTAVNFTGGLLLASTSIAPSGKATINLRDIEISLPPTLNIIVSVERAATGGSNQNFTGTLTWYEDV